VTDLFVVRTEIPMEAQHAFAKLHLRIKWALVSNLCKMHMSQVQTFEAENRELPQLKVQRSDSLGIAGYQ
jgi:hypothetical protein